VTQSADLPVRPFGAKLAEPAFAAGAPPDAPGAAPAFGLARIAALSMLVIAAPAAAAHSIPAANHHRACCPNRHSVPAVAAAPAKPEARQAGRWSAGGGAFTGWPRIAADLMP